MFPPLQAHGEGGKEELFLHVCKCWDHISFSCFLLVGFLFGQDHNNHVNFRSLEMFENDVKKAKETEIKMAENAVKIEE